MASEPDRVQRERQFHDRAERRSDRSRAGKYYGVQVSRAHYEAILSALAGGTDVLEIGCGRHSSAVRLALDGVDVTGIDISPVSVESARASAAAAGATAASFEVMNAESMTWPDERFGLCCGAGILHHLDLEPAYREIARVLRPDGRAVFLEALGTNPLINLYRRLTPSMRTPDEHPLKPRDFELSRRFFGEVHLTYYDFLTLLAVPVQRIRPTPRLRAALHRADRWLFRMVPWTRRLAWVAVIELAEPKSG